jgi:hypothetical protein
VSKKCVQKKRKKEIERGKKERGRTEKGGIEREKSFLLSCLLASTERDRKGKRERKDREKKWRMKTTLKYILSFLYI